MLKPLVRQADIHNATSPEMQGLTPLHNGELFSSIEDGYWALTREYELPMLISLNNPMAPLSAGIHRSAPDRYPC
jgi:hypothetical protein